MLVEHCLLEMCFIPLNANGPKFFGFSEFLAGFALMVLAWTIADVRYNFRVKTAPIPLQGLTFGIVAGIGALTMLTDLWRAEEWLVPQGNLLTPALWQAILASVFLLTVLTWAWFAFIKPPIYGKHNAERFAQTLYKFILKGSSVELVVIADELTRSASALVHHATNHPRHRLREELRIEPPKVEAYANDLLLLIADKRLCRAIVDSSPATALAIFLAVDEKKKYGVQVETFAKNIVGEALNNKDSFLYHEVEGYESGLIGYHKPLSQTMFGNYQMVEDIRTLLDPDFLSALKWDAEQWEAYCRIALITFRDYVDKRLLSHSSVLYSAMDRLQNATSDLYKLNGIPNTWENDEVARLRVIVKFIVEAIGVLDNKGVPDYLRVRVRVEHGHLHESIYDHLASAIFELISNAAAVKSPHWECWMIQHNSVWGELFRFNRLQSPAGRVVAFKLRRLLYDEIARMKHFPNFKGAPILGFCLNVMGLIQGEGNLDENGRTLHKAILTWTKKNYAWLHAYNPRVAEACLMGDITYDAKNLRLVRTFPAENLRREARYVYLEVDPAPQDEEPNKSGLT